MSSFRHLSTNTIQINGESFDLNLFLEIEPEYSLPEGATYREYVPKKHHILHINNNQTSGEFPWAEGDRYLNRIPDLHLLQKNIKEDEAYVEQIKREHNKKEKNRKTEYPSTHDLIIAMWEHFVEGKPAKNNINIIQEQRLKVKEKFPNENNL